MCEGDDIRISRRYWGCQSAAGHEATRIHANESRSEISDGRDQINAPVAGLRFRGTCIPSK